MQLAPLTTFSVKGYSFPMPRTIYLKLIIGSKDDHEDVCLQNEHKQLRNI